jgi:hypothetical protein
MFAARDTTVAKQAKAARLAEAVMMRTTSRQKGWRVCETVRLALCFAMNICGAGDAAGPLPVGLMQRISMTPQ